MSASNFTRTRHWLNVCNLIDQELRTCGTRDLRDLLEYCNEQSALAFAEPGASVHQLYIDQRIADVIQRIGREIINRT